MGETEIWTGKLTPLTIPDEYITWRDQVEFLLSEGVFFAYLDLDKEWFCTKDSDCVKLGDRWYSVHKTSWGPDEIMTAEKNGAQISFAISYYNGGCSFGEALEVALKTIDKD